MTTTPPSTPPPQTPVPSVPPAAPAPAPTANGKNWVQIGAAIGAALSIAGAAFSTFSSGGAGQSAGQANRAVLVTTEMIDQNRERMRAVEKHAEQNEHRIAQLEKQVAILEAQQPTQPTGAALTRSRSRLREPAEERR